MRFGWFSMVWVSLSAANPTVAELPAPGSYAHDGQRGSIELSADGAWRVEPGREGECVGFGVLAPAKRGLAVGPQAGKAFGDVLGAQRSAKTAWEEQVAETMATAALGSPEDPYAAALASGLMSAEEFRQDAARSVMDLLNRCAPDGRKRWAPRASHPGVDCDEFVSRLESMGVPLGVARDLAPAFETLLAANVALDSHCGHPQARGPTYDGAAGGWMPFSGRDWFAGVFGDAKYTVYVKQGGEGAMPIGGAGDHPLAGRWFVRIGALSRVEGLAALRVDPDGTGVMFTSDATCEVPIVANRDGRRIGIEAPGEVDCPSVAAFLPIDFAATNLSGDHLGDDWTRLMRLTR